MYRTIDFVMFRALEELADSFLNANVLLVVVVDAVVVAVVELGSWLNCCCFLCHFISTGSARIAEPVRKFRLLRTGSLNR